MEPTMSGIPLRNVFSSRGSWFPSSPLQTKHGTLRVYLFHMWTWYLAWNASSISPKRIGHVKNRESVYPSWLFWSLKMINHILVHLICWKVTGNSRNEKEHQRWTQNKMEDSSNKSLTKQWHHAGIKLYPYWVSTKTSTGNGWIMDESSSGTLDHCFRAINRYSTWLEVDTFVAIKAQHSLCLCNIGREPIRPRMIFKV